MKQVLTMGRLALLLAVSVGALTACSNTFNGMGRDMEHAGEKIQDTF